MSSGRRPSQPAPTPAQIASPTTTITPPKIASIRPSSRIGEDNKELRFTNRRLFSVGGFKPPLLDKKHASLKLATAQWQSSSEIITRPSAFRKRRATTRSAKRSGSSRANTIPTSTRTKRPRKKNSSNSTRPTKSSAIRRNERNTTSSARIGISRVDSNRHRDGTRNRAADFAATARVTAAGSISNSAAPASAISSRRFSVADVKPASAAVRSVNGNEEPNEEATSRRTSWSRSK